MDSAQQYRNAVLDSENIDPKNISTEKSHYVQNTITKLTDKEIPNSISLLSAFSRKIRHRSISLKTIFLVIIFANACFYISTMILNSRYFRRKPSGHRGPWYKHNKRPENGSDWKILGFANQAYLTPAKIWYRQLENLGYNEHFIVALDRSVFEELKNSSYRVLGAPKSGRYLDDGEGEVLKYEDIDSIWLRYVNLDTLPADFDIYHAICGTWPKAVYDAWGFVVCAGVAAYRSTNSSIEVLNHLADRCRNGCDDQALLNQKVYENTYKLKWEENNNITDILDPKYTGVVKRRHQVKKYGSLMWESWELNVMTFQEEAVKRNDAWLCRMKGNSWIMSPSVSKTEKAKMTMYTRFAKCMTKGVLDGLE